MKVICAWFKRTLGHVRPLSDNRETHGICLDCEEREFNGAKLGAKLGAKPDAMQ